MVKLTEKNIKLLEERISRPQAISSIGSEWAEILDRESINLEVACEVFCALIKSKSRGGDILIRGTGILKGLITTALSSCSYKWFFREENSIPFEEESFDLTVDIDPYTLLLSDDSRSISFKTLEFQQKYLEKLSEHRERVAGLLSAHNASSDNVVFFVAKQAYFNQTRISSSLRACGIKSVSVVLYPALKAHKLGYFDDVICTDLASFLEWLSTADRPVIHTQAWAFRQHIPVLIDAFLPRSGKQIVDLMDLNSLLLPRSRISALAPYIQQTWGETALANNDLQQKCERYLFESSHAILYQYDEGVKHKLLKNADTTSKWVQFFCYPSQEFFTNRHSSNCSDKKNRLVFVGGVTPNNGRHPAELFGDSQLIDLAKIVVEQDIELDVYNNPLRGSYSSFSSQYGEHLALSESYENYNFREGDLPDKIVSKIAAYDFGVMLYEWQAAFLLGEDHFRHIMPTKLFTYLEAGLPILVSEKLEAVSSFVEKNMCGARVSPSELRDLPGFIESLDYDALKAGVLATREALSMHKNMAKLISVYGFDDLLCH